MLTLVLAAFPILTILLINELYWRGRKTRPEYSRKVVHILTGCYVALWPFYLSWNDVRLLSLAMLVVVLLSRRSKLFPSIYKVRRKTIGDILYPLAFFILTFMTASEWIFAAAVLHMSLADGLAAVVGKRYGKAHRYKVLGAEKSWAGSAAFLVCSVLITGLTFYIAGFSYSGFHGFVWIPLIALLLENTGVAGSDNITVPIFVASSLEVLLLVG